MYMIIFGTMHRDLNSIKKYVEDEIAFSKNKDYIEHEYNNENHMVMYKCKNKYRKQNVFELFEKLKKHMPNNIELVNE